MANLGIVNKMKPTPNASANHTNYRCCHLKKLLIFVYVFVVGRNR